DDIPFDLKHQPHIVYGNSIADLKEQLARRVRWAIENPKKVEELFRQNIECFINSESITANPCIAIGGHKYIELAMHNVATKVIASTTFQLGIITPLWLRVHRITNSPTSKDIILTTPTTTNNQHVMTVSGDFVLRPDAWTSVYIELYYADR